MEHNPNVERIEFDHEGIQEIWDGLFSADEDGNFLSTKARVLSAKQSALLGISEGTIDKSDLEGWIGYAEEWEFYELAAGFTDALAALRIWELASVTNDIQQQKRDKKQLPEVREQGGGTEG